jgi:hypothetical protein
LLPLPLPLLLLLERETGLEGGLEMGRESGREEGREGGRKGNDDDDGRGSSNEEKDALGILGDHGSILGRIGAGLLSASEWLYDNLA